MGLGFVLVIWAVIGAVTATIAAVVCVAVAGFLTRRCRDGRRALLVAAAAFPFACLLWAAMVFVFQAAVNVVVMDRDVGLGDGFDCPLPNGYAMTFIDTTEFGTVYKPAGSLWNGRRENEIHDVVLLQVADRHIAGGIDSHAFDHLALTTHVADRWFLLDTQTGQRTDFNRYGDLELAARPVNIRVNLTPIGEVYSRYRLTWFDVSAGLLGVIPPVSGGIALLVWTFRIRRRREFTDLIIPECT